MNIQKRLSGYYVAEFRGVTITLIRQAAQKWAGSYRCPHGTKQIVKVVRRTRALALADCVAHLDEDAELFSGAE